MAKSCNCGAPISLPHARFCDGCRARRRRKPAKYVPTPQIDALIRETWQGKAWGLKAARIVAARVGWPHWIVKKRAVALGVVRQRKKEPAWSATEISVLERFAWMSPQRLAMKLSSATGIPRSATAVVLKRKRMRLLANADWYSAHQLAELLGIEGHKVSKWIKAGWLNADPRGTNRTERQGGDEWLIQRPALRRFLLAHPDEVDLAKVECAGSRLWFLDILTDGRIGERSAA
jgi:hypothetical protein